MKADSTFTSYAGQTWRTLLDTVSRGSDQKVDRKDLACFAGILASFAAGLAASWQCWGNPLVDSGRELNVPLRLVHGEMLYSDVNYFYGPFSPYLNALLYRALHPSLWVLWGRGMVSTVLILALSYWIARQIAGRFPATLACLAITWVCALKSQGNYMMAYAFGGVDGCTFVLATTVLLVVFLRKKSAAALFGAGILAGLAILSKTELGGVAVGTAWRQRHSRGIPSSGAYSCGLRCFWLLLWACQRWFSRGSPRVWVGGRSRLIAIFSLDMCLGNGCTTTGCGLALLIRGTRWA